jgi:hypothetical protein
MWTSPRVTIDCEPVKSQRIGDRDDVGGSVRNPSAGLRSGPAVTRAIVPNEPNAAATRVLNLPVVEQTGARRAVKKEDGSPMRVPILENA